jgi:S1-C subfamily serine protease
VAASLLIASGVGIGWGLSQGDGGSSSAIASPPTTGAEGGGSTTGGSTGGQVPPQGQVGGDAQRVAQSVEPAVVVIRTEIGTGAPGSFAQGSAAGTGMLITSSGEVLTNNHVIRGATRIEVTIQGEGTYPAEVVGADPTDDVALLQVEGVSGLPTITRDTSNLSVGMAVVAIGNAYGQGSASATAGRITGLEQTITAGDPGSAPERLSGLIQTNAAIAPGDSGGALVDTQGEVVGMITAASQTSAFTRTSTQGYAIAIDDAFGIVNRIQSGQATGDIVLGRPGLLGVQVRDLDNAAAARLGLATDGGAFIVEVVPDTPAADAGMTAGSAITSINGHAIGSADDLGNVMHTTKPGEQATVEWVSNDGPHSATVQLITAPAV